VRKPHTDVEPVKNWQFSDARVRENAPETRTTVAEHGQHQDLGAPNGFGFTADQRFDSCIGFRDGAEYLPATSLCFDIADPHLRMPLSVPAAPYEG
jgi:hypothetical protein